jgi:hypothetical protein
MTPAEVSAHLDEAFAVWERRSAVPWTVDLAAIKAARIEVVQRTIMRPWAAR